MASELASLVDECIRHNLIPTLRIFVRDITTGNFVRLSKVGSPDLEMNQDYFFRVWLNHEGNEEGKDPLVEFKDVQVLVSAGKDVKLWEDELFKDQGKTWIAGKRQFTSETETLTSANRSAKEDFYFRTTRDSDGEEAAVAHVQVKAGIILRGGPWTPKKYRL